MWRQLFVILSIQKPSLWSCFFLYKQNKRQTSKVYIYKLIFFIKQEFKKIFSNYFFTLKGSLQTEIKYISQIFEIFYFKKDFKSWWWEGLSSYSIGLIIFCILEYYWSVKWRWLKQECNMEIYLWMHIHRLEYSLHPHPWNWKMEENYACFSIFVIIFFLKDLINLFFSEIKWEMREVARGFNLKLKFGTFSQKGNDR